MFRIHAGVDLKDDHLIKDSEQALLVRSYRDEDEGEVLQLLRAAFGDWPIVEGAPEKIDPLLFFRWKHLAGPFGESRMLVAEQEGDLVGFRASMPWTLRAGARTVQALRGVDLATRPGLERAGIYGRLRQEATALHTGQADLLIGTPNQKSLGATMKAGWELVGTLRESVRVRPLRVVAALLRRDLTPPPVEAETAAEALADWDDLALLLEEARGPDSRLSTAKDVAYLRWRYGAVPLDYHAVREQRDGRACGLALFRIRLNRGLWEAVIDEILVGPGDRRTATRLLRRISRAAPVAVLRCHFPPGTVQQVAARRQSFLPWRGALPLIVTQLNGGVVPPPNQLTSWALSLGDLEIV